MWTIIGGGIAIYAVTTLLIGWSAREWWHLEYLPAMKVLMVGNLVPASLTTLRFCLKDRFSRRGENVYTIVQVVLVMSCTIWWYFPRFPLPLAAFILIGSTAISAVLGPSEVEHEPDHGQVDGACRTQRG